VKEGQGKDRDGGGRKEDEDGGQKGDETKMAR